MDSPESRRQQQAASISAGRIARIIKRALPQAVLKSFELLTGGAVNLSYMLRFDGTEAPVVLRIYTGNPSACQKEARLLLSAAPQLPVPELIYANPKGEEDVAPYVLYRYAEGITFQELKARGSLLDMAEAAYAIGAALARLQTFSVVWSTGLTSCHEITDDCLYSPVLEQRLGGAKADRLRNFVTAWLPLIRLLYQEKALVHGAFSNRNTIVKHGGSGWVVTGILDWEHAFSGSPLWDAARFICFERRARPCREPHFSRGFCDNGGSLPNDWGTFSRALNAFTATESLSRPGLSGRFIPDLRELLVATLDNRDLS
jgi:aminoglycoside phosphotransferase (APT) family kinase protein